VTVNGYRSGAILRRTGAGSTPVRLALERLAAGLLEPRLRLAGPRPVARFGGARRPWLLLAPGLLDPRLLARRRRRALGPLDPLGLAFAGLGGRRRVAVDARRPRLLRRIAVGARLAEGPVGALRPIALRLVPFAQAALARRLGPGLGDAHTLVVGLRQGGAEL